MLMGATNLMDCVKDVDYDFAFLFGVGPEDFFFDIASHKYLCETMTTNMSKEVVGSYKHTIAQKNLNAFTTDNLFNKLQELGLV